MEENSILEKKYLDAMDYTIFVGMLVVSTLLGVCFAFLNKRRPNTTSEYLIGNKELSVFPIAMSLSASYISPTSFLGVPTEVYLYGSQIMLNCFSSALSIVLMIYAVLPVFYDLNLLSSYEYLTKRFNYKIGMLASALFLLKMIIFAASTIYAPAIVLSQLTGFNYKILIPVLTIVCTFYTCIGGLRAVVWADTLQMVLMLAGTFALTILGLYHVEGFENVWELNKNSGRIEFFNFDPDPRVRTTFWTVTIGNLILSLGHKCTSQMVVQRCLSLSSFDKSKITLWIFTISAFIIVLVNGFNGLVAFATFYDCDPITTKTVSKPDQIIPYLWIYLTQNIPALPGIFVSAIFSASFSTISTVLNSMAGVFVIDIVKPLTKKSVSEAKATFLMKVMVVIFGITLIFLAFLMDQLGGLYQIFHTFTGLTNGPVFGMFVLRMFFPKVNSKGALVGGMASFGFLSWMCVGAQMAISQKKLKFPKKPFFIDGCDNITLQEYYTHLNLTKINSTINQAEPFPLYAISFQYYSLIGLFVAVVVGILVSYCTANDSSKRVNVNLYSPFIRKYVKLNCKKAAEEVNLYNVE